MTYCHHFKLTCDIQTQQKDNTYIHYCLNCNYHNAVKVLKDGTLEAL